MGRAPVFFAQSRGSFAMVFSSPLFLFIFLPAVLGVYYLAPGRAKNYVLIAFSLAFYFWGEPSFVFVVLGSTLFDWLVVRAMHATTGHGRRKFLVFLGVLANVGILVYFKYMNFFADAVSALLVDLGLNPFVLAKIALPIGVSFVVFEKITYLVDVYRDVGKPARNFADYLLYVFSFPSCWPGRSSSTTTSPTSLSGASTTCPTSKPGSAVSPWAWPKRCSSPTPWPKWPTFPLPPIRPRWARFSPGWG